MITDFCLKVYGTSNQCFVHIYVPVRIFISCYHVYCSSSFILPLADVGSLLTFGWGLYGQVLQWFLEFYYVPCVFLGIFSYLPEDKLACVGDIIVWGTNNYHEVAQ